MDFAAVIEDVAQELALTAQAVEQTRPDLAAKLFNLANLLDDALDAWRD